MMTFYFERTNRTGQADEKAIVHVSVDTDLDTIKFEVDLDSLPEVDIYNNFYGHEVIVDFSVEDFDNNNTFWTDSNGLEMQKRVLNYRPTWDIQANYNDSNENVTANYYPINSAISMKDVTQLPQGRVFTVMNDRPQSGSALGPGSI